jgi:hypothetical protein
MPLVLSLVALFLTGELGLQAIELSYKFSSDSESSLDMLGRTVLDSVPPRPVAYDRAMVRGSMERDALALNGRMLRGDTTGARAALLTLAQLADGAGNFLWLSLKYAQLRDLPRAIAFGESAVARDPSDAVAHSQLGLYYGQLAESLSRTGDSASSRREAHHAIDHYDNALARMEALGIARAMWVKSLRWWARASAGLVGIAPREVTTHRLWVRGTEVLCALVFLATLTTECGIVRRIRRGCRRRGARPRFGAAAPSESGEAGVGSAGGKTDDRYPPARDGRRS